MIAAFAAVGFVIACCAPAGFATAGFATAGFATAGSATADFATADSATADFATADFATADFVTADFVTADFVIAAPVAAAPGVDFAGFAATTFVGAATAGAAVGWRGERTAGFAGFVLAGPATGGVTAAGTAGTGTCDATFDACLRPRDAARTAAFNAAGSVTGASCLTEETGEAAPTGSASNAVSNVVFISFAPCLVGRRRPFGDRETAEPGASASAAACSASAVTVAASAAAAAFLEVPLRGLSGAAGTAAGAIEGTARSILRRVAPKLLTTSVTVSPRSMTSRALRGAGSAISRSGTYPCASPIST